MMLRNLSLVILLLASSNALLLRGGTLRKLGSGSGENTGDCGGKISGETLDAFGLGADFNCTMYADKSEFDCVATDASLLSPQSTCFTTEECRAQDLSWSCFYVPNVLSGPAGLPLASCGTRESIAASVDTGKVMGVALSVPKEICIKDIAIP